MWAGFCVKLSGYISIQMAQWLTVNNDTECLKWVLHNYRLVILQISYFVDILAGPADPSQGDLGQETPAGRRSLWYKDKAPRSEIGERTRRILEIGRSAYTWRHL